ncbi:MAG: hypothetical protein M3496_11880 [Pseudomonadota bacterium]|nr:hypothetical protein [Pseudomonadota bacterium]
MREEAAKAIDPLRKAAALAPQRSDIRFNYAKALIEDAKKDVATSEVQALQSTAGDFASRSEIAAI